MSRGIVHSLFFLLTCLVGYGQPVVTLELAPGPDNPRNSEGDFIRLRDGRVLFVYTRFTGGGSDHDRADLVGRVSSDGGRTWSDTDRMMVRNEGDWNVMSVSLLRLADGRIALFYLQKNSLEDCRPVVRFSSDEAETWSAPNGIIPDEDKGYYVVNNDRVIQLENGRLLMPVALHNRPGWEKPDWRGEITCYLSDDAGRSWRRSTTLRTAEHSGGERIVAQEPGAIELKDGRVMIWVRTNQGEPYRAWSDDGGDSFSKFEPMGIASPRSPATIERLPSTGDLLLAWNNHAHLPVNQRKWRTPLTIAISRDEGETWTGVKNIAEDPNGWYCYTAMTVIGDHLLLGHCAGDRRTGGLNLTRVTRIPVNWLYQ